nr:tubulin--tyrosine ligase family protein [Pseudomonadota bacterium]
GDFVIQRYIDNPNLLNGHKYTLRLYVILTNYQGFKLYEHGYYNIGMQKYPGKQDIKNLAAHLTNEHLTEPYPNVVQMPTSNVKEFHLLMPQIQSIVNQTLGAFAKVAPEYFAPSSRKAFDILGFDFLLDAALQVWLIEINHGPWFPTTDPHILQAHLYDAFWQMLVDEFITPLVGSPKNLDNK